MSRVSNAKHVPVTVMPLLREDVPPSLRFMLGDEAREDGWAFYRFMSGLTWGTGNESEWCEKHVVGKLAERWPYVARADAAVGGLLSDALRVVAANDPRTAPRRWLCFAVVLANGHPELLRDCCERVIGLKPSGKPKPEIHPEEAPDPIMRAAARHWQDIEYEGPDLAGD